MKHQYDFDAATAIGFLRQYGLDRDFKLNIEANHATLAGHTFQHDLRISAINGMLGSIDANQGDDLRGGDGGTHPSGLRQAGISGRRGKQYPVPVGKHKNRKIIQRVRLMGQ